MIGVDGVADVDVEGPVGAQQQLVGGLVHPHRRHHCASRSIDPTPYARASAGGEIRPMPRKEDEETTKKGGGGGVRGWDVVVVVEIGDGSLAGRLGGAR